MSPCWKDVRAVFVILHLLAITLQALPSPGGGLRRSAWKDPTVQGELDAWAERLLGAGFSVDRDQLEERLWRFAKDYQEVRLGVLRPFAPYYRWAGTGQSWRMFVAPHRYPSTLSIDVRQGQEWRRIYEARSRRADWHRLQLDHSRMRSSVFRYAWRPYRGHYRRFVDWVAREVGEDFPEATAVRVQYDKRRTPTPREVREGIVPRSEVIQQRVVELGVEQGS